jgi:hypothetical protein
MNKVILLFIILVSAAGCSSITTSYDYDKAADFTKYHTYNFGENTAKLEINQLDKDRIKAAIDNEMIARGYTKADNPDLLVDIQVRLKEGQTATATTTGPGMYGYGYGYRYGSGFSTTHIDVNSYIEGTLFINVGDNAEQKLIWQGRGTKTLDENASPQKREKNIKAGVTQIFTKYPVPKKKS